MVTGVFVTLPRVENVAPLVFHRARDHQIYMRPISCAIGDRRGGGGEQCDATRPTFTITAIVILFPLRSVRARAR